MLSLAGPYLSTAIISECLSDKRLCKLTKLFRKIDKNDCCVSARQSNKISYVPTSTEIRDKMVISKM